jgi:hypothetical protein
MIRIRGEAVKATAKYYIKWEPEDLAQLLTEENITTNLDKFKRKFFPIGSVIPTKDGTCTAKFEMFRLYHLKLYQLIYPPDDSIQPFILKESQRLVDFCNKKLARFYFEARESDEMIKALAVVAKSDECSFTDKLWLQSESDKVSKERSRRLERAEKYLAYLSDTQPAGFEADVQSLLQEMLTEPNDWVKQYSLYLWVKNHPY